MRKIYCISGLGADERFFDRLAIDGYEFVPVHWVQYDKDDDTMATYAARMAEVIKEEDAIVVGLSFGGMLGVEIAKTHPGWKVFLVSSAKTKAELGYTNGTGMLIWLIKNSLVPSFVFNKPNPVVDANMGVQTREERALLHDVMRKSDPVFMRWCIQRLIDWDNIVVPANVTHVHGTNDKVIASKNVHPDQWIEGGTHIMIYNRAEEVSKFISDCLGK